MYFFYLLQFSILLFLLKSLLLFDLNENLFIDEFKKYKPISEFPSTYRDLSFLIKDNLNLKELDNTILNFDNEFIKEVFMFDYYLNKETNNTPIWIMRQAGRYLPEFREIRKVNPDFIKLCLNENITPEITLQPLKRYELDAAIIFSDILMLPYGIGQKVEFQKGFGPILGDLNLNSINKINNIGWPYY